MSPTTSVFILHINRYFWANPKIDVEQENSDFAKKMQNYSYTY